MHGQCLLVCRWVDFLRTCIHPYLSSLEPFQAGSPLSFSLINLHGLYSSSIYPLPPVLHTQRPPQEKLYYLFTFPSYALTTPLPLRQSRFSGNLSPKICGQREDSHGPQNHRLLSNTNDHQGIFTMLLCPPNHTRVFFFLGGPDSTRSRHFNAISPTP